MDMTATVDTAHAIVTADEASAPEVSVVIPCLNEADTLGRVSPRRSDVREHGIDGEIIVADNGSTDGSQ